VSCRSCRSISYRGTKKTENDTFVGSSTPRKSSAPSHWEQCGSTPAAARAGATGVAISLCDANERDQLHDIERLIRQSIPAEDRRSSAGELDNRPRMCIQSARTRAARPSVQWTITKGAHVGDARSPRGAAAGITIQWRSVIFRFCRSRAGASGRAPLRGRVRLGCSLDRAKWRPSFSLERLGYGDAHGASQIQGRPTR
jgi:hypothetical protein